MTEHKNPQSELDVNTNGLNLDLKNIEEQAVQMQKEDKNSIRIGVVSSVPNLEETIDLYKKFLKKRDKLKPVKHLPQMLYHFVPNSKTREQVSARINENLPYNNKNILEIHNGSFVKNQIINSKSIRQRR